jgi:hypothetical protein
VDLTEEVTAGLRQLYHQELHDFSSSTNIQFIKSRHTSLMRACNTNGQDKTIDKKPLVIKYDTQESSLKPYTLAWRITFNWNLKKKHVGIWTGFI